MGARAGQCPIENPENEDQTQTKPPMHGKSAFFIDYTFRVDTSCHSPSLHLDFKDFQRGRVENVQKELSLETNKFAMNQNILFFIKNLDRIQNVCYYSRHWSIKCH